VRNANSLNNNELVMLRVLLEKKSFLAKGAS